MGGNYPRAERVGAERGTSWHDQSGRHGARKYRNDDSVRFGLRLAQTRPSGSSHWTVGRMASLELSCSSKENLLHVLCMYCVSGGAMGAVSFFFIFWLTMGDSDSVTVDQGESRWVRGIQVSRLLIARDGTQTKEAIWKEDGNRVSSSSLPGRAESCMWMEEQPTQSAGVVASEHDDVGEKKTRLARSRATPNGSGDTAQARAIDEMAMDSFAAPTTLLHLVAAPAHSPRPPRATHHA
ncbi:uncharacterized protein IWZ02DRAFT_84494 [Phyllosticta citriasiana]|uniref:uncharacterized protein n=1 Tax=Phyllosticta citriasiana TaxID=595635 RepID=UPI0030FDF07D